MKMNWLVNPFERISGWQALLPGLAAMALTACLGSLGNVSFDGVLDVHLAPNTFRQALVMQGTAWLCLFAMLWGAGACFSRSRIRAIDLAGVAALSRTPMLAIAAVACMVPVATLPFGLSITIVLVLCIVFEVWMLLLMYQGYALCCNLRGLRSGLSFTGAVVAAEVLSKVVLMFVLAGVFATPAAAQPPLALAPVSDHAIRQAAAEVMDGFAKGDYAKVTARFDATMKAALPASQLKIMWSQLEMKLGKYEKSTVPEQSTEKDGYRILMIPCIFAKGNIVIQLTFNAEGMISGLFLR